MQKQWARTMVQAVLPAGTRRWIGAQLRHWVERLDKSLLLFKYNLRPTDTFLVGHPKSGNTWMAYMLALVLQKSEPHRITLANIGDYVPVIHGREGAVARHSDLPDPRIFRNEWPLCPDLYPKTIYLVRDPRAAILSYYHMYRTVFADPAMPLRTFVEDYLSCSGKWERELVRWDIQVLNWLKRAEQSERVMIVKYEDMVHDRRKVLKRVMEFAGISCTRQDLALAVERSSFEAMRKDEEKHGAESYPGEIRQRGRFIRRGSIDGWMEEMDQPIVELINAEFAPAMKVLGYL